MLHSRWLKALLDPSRRTPTANGGRHGLLALALAAWLPLCLPASPPPAEELPRLVGTVTRVVDGDTIDVKLASDPIRVRLNAVDAPERKQPWGAQASRALEKLVLGKVVQLEPFQQDRYDRLVARVYRGNLDINGELIKQGHAWASRRYMKRRDAAYCVFEAQARVAKRGLWSLQAGRPVAPWEWRKRKSLREFTDYNVSSAAVCSAAIGRR